MPPAAEAMNTGLPCIAVEHDAEIEFAFDGQRLFDQQALHHAAFGPGLVRDQRHAEDLARDLGGLARQSLRDFDAAALAAAAGVDLRFHHHAAADALARRLPPPAR